MRKIVIFGGGTGISRILEGLKLFPLDVTAVIAVSDDGSSTGVLKEELDIPAVGDLGKVLLSMANVDDDVVKLLRYRFQKDGTLHNHPVRNVLLAALTDLKGNLTEASKFMCRLLNVKGTILPLTEEKVELIGHSKNGPYIGQCAVSNNIKNIDYLTYDHSFSVSPEIIEKISEADLIILSPGSLYTSIIPHLIAPDVRDAIADSNVPIMYVSNLVSQPGETDNYTVGDHIKVLNRYLENRKVDIVITNNGLVDSQISDVYRIKEQKSIVPLDEQILKELGVEVISDDIICIEDGSIRHDELKTAFLVFSYLMNH